MQLGAGIAPVGIVGGPIIAARPAIASAAIIPGAIGLGGTGLIGHGKILI